MCVGDILGYCGDTTFFSYTDSPTCRAETALIITPFLMNLVSFIGILFIFWFYLISFRCVVFSEISAK